MTLATVGAVTRQGMTIEVRLDAGAMAVTARIMESDAERLVTAVLLQLAQLNPLRWGQIFDDVRDAQR